MDKSSVFKGYLIAIAALGAAIAIALYAFLRDPQEETPDKFGFGKVAGADRIKALDIDVMADGRGLPAGTGDIRQGLIIYAEKCVSCHGNGEKVDYKLPGDALFVNQPAKKTKTIGTYWPYATTIFDYIRRAMPYNAPGSLSDQEVYHLTAYLLYANKVIPANTVINEHSLPKIVMPAKKNYVVDDREGGSDIR